MLQFPLFPAGMNGQPGALAAGLERGGAALQALLEGAQATDAAFAGELQAVLMQLSPQLLQRLDELVSGGMGLPQAAKNLLAERGLGAPASPFARLAEQGLAEVTGQADDAAVRQALARETKLDGLFEGLAGRLASAAAPDRPPATVALPGAVPGVVQPISPPLAASLLDMGVPQQVGAKGWDSAVADRLLWMVQGDLQFARLKLNPPNLGPLEVRLTVSQDQSSVAFLSQHAAVREALEAALPRLREMFDQQSLQLLRADVSDPGAQHGDRTGEGAGRSGAHAADGPPMDAVEDAGTASPRVLNGAADGLVDLFA
jgi:flagellar hook-length control protein FliK